MGMGIGNYYYMYLIHCVILFLFDRDSKSSFTSLSERVASILRDFHAGLIYALEKEQQPQVLTLIMKLTCVLIVNSPYDRLAPGYVEKIYKTVLKKWTNGSMLDMKKEDRGPGE